MCLFRIYDGQSCSSSCGGQRFEKCSEDVEFAAVTSTNYATFLKMVEDFQKCCLTLRVSKEDVRSFSAREMQTTDDFNGYVYPTAQNSSSSGIMAMKKSGI